MVVLSVGYNTDTKGPSDVIMGYTPKFVSLQRMKVPKIMYIWENPPKYINYSLFDNILKCLDSLLKMSSVILSI